MTRSRRRSARRRTSGFTLIEMLVATVLASVVLLGLFNFVTNAVQSEVKGMRTGTVAAWSLTAMSALSADISGASQLSYPASGSGSDFLIVCSNWSAKMGTMGTAGGVLYGGGGGPASQQYCWDTTDAAPFGNTILRMTTASCPAAPVTPCNTANYGTNGVVATGVYRDAANDSIFYADPKTLNAVRIRLNVGNPAGNATSAGGNNGTVLGTAISIPYNTEIILED
jgi:prepilin-type N-terminal cleavage/methylation domain-containing protein